MSNRDHLIENALYSIMRGISFKEWKEMERGNVYGNAGKYSLEEFSDRDLEIIWSCAYYIKYTWCEGWCHDDFTKFCNEECNVINWEFK